jgi:hypothetical protein
LKFRCVIKVQLIVPVIDLGNSMFAHVQRDR